MKQESNIKKLAIYRLILIILPLLAFVFIAVYMLKNSYQKDIKDAKKAEFKHLKGIVNTLSQTLNPGVHKKLMNKYSEKDAITQSTQDSLYYQIHKKLQKVKKKNNLHTDIYTLVLKENVDFRNLKNSVYFGVSSGKPYFRHLYTPPKKFVKFYNQGATYGPYKDNHGTWLSAFAPLKDKNGNTVAVIQADSKFDKFIANINDILVKRSSYIGALLLFLGTFITFFISRITNKIFQNHQQINQKNEELNNSYRGILKFIQNVEKGDYEADIKELNSIEDNDLTNSLENMRRELKENKEKENAERWIINGKTELNDVIKKFQDTEKVAFSAIKYITEYTNAIQGAIYDIKEKDELNKEEKPVQMIARYAYGRKKYDLDPSFFIGEGLPGQCAFEKAEIYRTEIPDDYMTITSGILGDKKPKAILLYPLIADNKLQGIIEIASLDKFTELERQFLQNISELIGRTLYNLKVNEKTLKLLEESREKSAELQEQQEELQQNAEEMKATQEELQRTNQKLEDQVKEVERSENRLYTLLEKASEVISIYDNNGELKYESPSVENILGFSPEEMKNNQNLLNDQVEVDKLKDMFYYLLDNPEETYTVEYPYKNKEGEDVWLESYGRNLLEDPAIEGLLLNTRDITQRKMAEKEREMRGKMQSLSENSPDIIIRLDETYKFVYINPMLWAYSGVSPDELMNKNIEEESIPLNQKITQSWKEALEDAKQTGEIAKKEIDFPTEDKNYIMQVNAIPEYDSNNNIESVLVVSHDITTRKEQEKIIEQTNKRLTDSINYAKRIQNSIIPYKEELEKSFKDHFIFYYPKDVISGDFPWFFQKGNKSYIAAVDCTGHGVPGAMMSLIGFLLLNDIVNDQQDLDPATILSRLHERVVKTLRQTESENKAADGMDVALICIEHQNYKIQFAGAHRPLYHLTDGEIVQYKGDKLPIGGTQYNSEGEHNFTNNVLSFKEGDSVYFFSDGLPDQFGGPRNLKYGPKRIRKKILEYQNFSMDEIKTAFEQDFEYWKNNEKQLDDILLIGIKL